MSKITLEPNSSGAGTFSIQSPDSNSNRVLTLPDNDGTVLSTVSDLAAGQLTGTVDAARMPSDSIIQAKSVYYTGASSDNSFDVWKDFPGDIGQGISITPTSSNSKFMIMWSLHVHRNSSGLSDGNFSCHVRLGRTINGSLNDTFAVGDARGPRTRSTFSVRTSASGIAVPARTGSFIDSPNTDQTIIYNVRFNNAPGASNSTPTFFNRNPFDFNDAGSGYTAISSLVVMELA